MAHSFLTSDSNDGVVYINLDSEQTMKKIKGFSWLGIPEDKQVRLSAIDEL